MELTERLRRVFLRWGQLGLAGVMLLPLLVAAGLGFVWLHERGWLLVFVLGSVGFVIGFRALRLALRLWQARRADAGGDEAASATGSAHAAQGAHAAQPPDPDWTAKEADAYRRACDRIAERLATPLPWDRMPAEALAVIETVAADLSRGGRGALDFTLPEALLLIDRVALRYRVFLRRAVPFSDQLSVWSLWWLWQRRDTAQVAWRSGYAVWRGVRLAINPAVGVLREIERVVTSGLQVRLGDQMRRDAQAVLLEEVAQAAVDLYSGRLRFSDAELLEFQLGAEARDRALLARPDAPLRIVLVGQLSAGKSTLVNALRDRDAAETDMAPTTDAVAVYEITIAGTPCRLLDTPGLDGSGAAQDRMVAQMLGADIVLWVLRANRGARAPDVDMMAAFDTALAQQPARRRPPVIVVATGADLLVDAWPYAENRLPQHAAERIGAAMAAINADLGGASPIPVCAEPPSWNIDMVRDALAAALPDALMVQRNRTRLGAERGGRQLGDNLRRAARGARAGVRYMGGRLWPGKD